MTLRSAVFVLLLVAAGPRAQAGNPPPTLVKLPCQSVQLVSLIEYYTAETVGAQVNIPVHAQLSRFAQAKKGERSSLVSSDNFSCIARVDIGYQDKWDVGWVEYSLPKEKPFAVTVAFRFAHAPGGYALPTDAKPRSLDASILTKMQSSQSNSKSGANTNGPNLPIVEYEVLGEARQRLVEAGWQPKKTLHPDDAGAREFDFIAAGYTEVDSCAIDWSYCSFNYVDANGICLTVTSEGEYPKGAYVSGWRFGCPTSDNQ